MAIVRTTTIIDGELEESTEKRFRNLDKADEYAEELAQPGRIVCVKHGKKVKRVL